MRLLLYARRETRTGKKLQDVIKVVAGKNELEIHRDLNSFCCSLRRQIGYRYIVVLLAETNEDFSDFVSIQKLLLDLSIIFIVPDRKQNTLYKAHCFFPRFITTDEFNFSDLKVVLERMIQNMNKEKWVTRKSQIINR